MHLAIFDVDGTLVRGSTERAFGRYLAMRGVLGPRQAWSFVALGLRSLPGAGAQFLKKDKGYLAGLRVDAIERLAAGFVAEQVTNRLVTPVVARLDKHLGRGDFVVLLSGTLDAIVRQLAASLGAHRGIGSLCATHEHCYIAAPPLLHPFGETKVGQMQSLARGLGVASADIVAYADSVHDLALLRSVGTPVAVRPDRRLRRAAMAGGWEIIEDQPVRRASPA